MRHTLSVTRPARAEAVPFGAMVLLPPRPFPSVPDSPVRAGHHRLDHVMWELDEMYYYQFSHLLILIIVLIKGRRIVPGTQSPPYSKSAKASLEKWPHLGGWNT